MTDLWDYDDEDRAKLAAGWTPVHSPPQLTKCWLRPKLSPAVGLRRDDETGDAP